MVLRFVIPCKTINELNDHSHWRNRQRRARVQHKAVASVISALSLDRPELPCVVNLTRVSRGMLDPDDGLNSSCKFVRDAIAKWLGVDDKHSHIVKYKYDQRRGTPPAVEVEIVPMGEAK